MVKNDSIETEIKKTKYTISNNNVMSEEYYFTLLPNKKYKSTYTYDTKKNLFKNVKGIKYLIQSSDSSEYNLLHTGYNNRLISNEDLGYTTESKYTYNTSDYPIECIFKVFQNGNETDSSKITIIY